MIDRPAATLCSTDYEFLITTETIRAGTEGTRQRFPSTMPLQLYEKVS